MSAADIQLMPIDLNIVPTLVYTLGSVARSWTSLPKRLKSPGGAHLSAVSLTKMESLAIHLEGHGRALPPALGSVVGATGTPEVTGLPTLQRAEFVEFRSARHQLAVRATEPDTVAPERTVSRACRKRTIPLMSDNVAATDGGAQGPHLAQIVWLASMGFTYQPAVIQARTRQVTTLLYITHLLMPRIDRRWPYVTTKLHLELTVPEALSQPNTPRGPNHHL